MAIVTGFLAAAALAAGPAAPATSTAQVLPTVYEAGHFYAVPETTDGQRLRLLVDTGGGGTAGLYWITTQAATRLGLKTRACKRGNSSVNVADLPRYRPGQGLPSPFSGPCGLWPGFHPALQSTKWPSVLQKSGVDRTAHVTTPRPSHPDRLL